MVTLFFLPLSKSAIKLLRTSPTATRPARHLSCILSAPGFSSSRLLGSPRSLCHDIHTEKTELASSYCSLAEEFRWCDVVPYNITLLLR